MAPPDNKMDVTAEDDSKKGEAMGMMVLSNGKRSQQNETDTNQKASNSSTKPASTE